MAKQWATRVIVAFQSACWCVAILLLLSRGVSNLKDSLQTQPAPAPSSQANATSYTDQGSHGRGFTLGVALITVAVLMIVASPVIVVARVYDRRRYSSVDRFPDLGLPPRYEDIVSRAPSYSTLFDMGIVERDEETQQLQELPFHVTVV